MACTRCQKVVQDSDRITCRGYCGCSFHTFCAQVDQPLLETLGEHARNVFWMCDDCADLFSSDHFRSIIKRSSAQSVDETSINSLKEDIVKLSDAVSSLSAKVDAKPLTPMTKPVWRNVNWTNSPTPKRKRDDDSTVKIPIIRGTKPTCPLVKAVQKDDADECVWIYLSAFHPSTSEAEIATLTKDCLNMEMDAQPKVVKLIPKGRDISSLSFVSFKIGVNIALKDVALSSSSWPENVCFREFENHPKNERQVVSINQPVDTSEKSA